LNIRNKFKKFWVGLHFFKHLLSFSGYFPIQEPSFSGTISFALGAMAEKEAAVQHRPAAKVWLRVIL
jgi:hypothetical protein